MARRARKLVRMNMLLKTFERLLIYSVAQKKNKARKRSLLKALTLRGRCESERR